GRCWQSEPRAWFDSNQEGLHALVSWPTGSRPLSNVPRRFPIEFQVRDGVQQRRIVGISTANGWAGRVADNRNGSTKLTIEDRHAETKFHPVKSFDDPIHGGPCGAR